MYGARRGWPVVPIHDGHDATGQPYLGERCKSPRCAGHRIGVGFHVRDEDWSAVVGDSGTIWCFPCFDAEAQRLGVRYKILDYTRPIPWWEFVDA